MPACLITLIAFLDRRLDRRERGDVVAFLGLAFMVIAVILVMLPAFRDVVSTAMDSIKTKIGGIGG